MTADEAVVAAQIQQQLRLCQEEIQRKDRLLAKLSSNGRRPAAAEQGGVYNKEPLTVQHGYRTDHLARIENLESQLREMRYLVDVRNAEISELKGLFDSARLAEAKNAQVTEQLRQRLSQRDSQGGGAGNTSSSGSGRGITNDGVQQEVQQLRDQIADINSRLRISVDDRENAEQQRAKAVNQLSDVMSQLSRLLFKDDWSHGSSPERSCDTILHKIQELSQENVTLRNKLSTVRDFMLATESEQRTKRDSIVKMLNDRSQHILPLSHDTESLQVERDKAIMRQHELMSEVTDLKDRLEKTHQTCTALRHQLEASTVTDGTGRLGNIPEHSESFKQDLARLLSDDYITVQPQEADIQEHLQILCDSVHNKNAQIEQLRINLATLLDQLDVQNELTRVAEHRAKRAEAAMLDLEDRLHSVDSALAESNFVHRELHVDHQRYVSYLERIARALRLDPLPDDISIDGATETIIIRANQLCELDTGSRRELISNLQRKVKSLKDRLDNKEHEAESLQNENKLLKDQLDSTVESHHEQRDDEYAKNRKLLKLVEKYKHDLKEAKDDLHKLKSKFEDVDHAQSLASTKAEEISKLEMKIKELEHCDEGREHKIGDLKQQIGELSRQYDEASNMVEMLRAELSRTKSTLVDITRQHTQLMELRHVIARMLGLHVSMSSIADFEIVTRLEKIILASQSNLVTPLVAVNGTLAAELAEAYREGRQRSVSPVMRDVDEPPSARTSRGDRTERSRSLSPVRTRDPNVY
jgi:predicted  nucleic acid-binding Zn-ribbon protein